MYLIGEFSKITNLTLKTLRYYDQEHILIPTYRDSRSGYRYYDEANYQQGIKLRQLRELGFSINEIKKILAQEPFLNHLEPFLKEKQKEIEYRIQSETLLLASISDVIKETTVKNKVAEQPDGEVNLSKSTDTLYLSSSFVGPYVDVEKHIGPLYEEAKKRVSGPLFSLLHDQSYQELATIEVCLAISEVAPLSNHTLTLQKMNSLDVISCLHHGSYDTLNITYKKILDEAKFQNLDLVFPSQEIYLRSPLPNEKTDNKKLLTHVQIPFRRKLLDPPL